MGKLSPGWICAFLSPRRADVVCLDLNGHVPAGATRTGYGGCYAFIAGTPFAYVDYYHVSPQIFGLLFGVNILGLMVVNFIDTWLVVRLGANHEARYASFVLEINA